MRVAVLCHGDAAVESCALELAEALRHAGHETRLLVGPGYPAVEAFLLWRGFTEGLSAVPSSVAELRRGRFDVAHAFTAVDVDAALRWGGGPVVFGVAEVLGRERVANRRQRLSLLRRAVDESAAVVATGESQRAALGRWLAVDAPVLAPSDAEGHARLYAGL